MNISYDKNNKSVQSKVYLARPGEHKICILNSIQEDSASLSLKLRECSPLSFTLDQYVYDPESGKQFPANGYDKIDYHMEIFLSEYGWFRINEPPEIDNDGYTETKIVSAESIESELNDFPLVGFKVNYGTVDSIEMMVDENVIDYPDGLRLPKSQVKFYNPDNPQLSLLDIILEDTYKWKVGHVDASLKNLICRFDIDSTNKYTFLMNDASQAYECIFVFDYMNFEVNAYSLNEENILNTGMFKDTNIILGFRGVENSLVQSSDRDIYTVYNVQGGDDLTIRYVNFGETEIEDISYFLTTKYMPQELIDKYVYWRDYRENRRPEYIELSKQYNAQLEVVSELKNRIPSSGCQTDWTQISDDELLTSYSNYIALQTGYETAYVDEEGNFDLSAIKNSTDWDDYYSTITYVIPALKNEIGVRGLDSNINESGTVDYDYNAWETDWDLYGVDELQSKLDEYNELIASLDDFSQETNPSDKNYTDAYFAEMRQTYLGYVAKRDSCSTALAERKSEYNTANAALESISTSRQDIVSDVSKNNPQFGFTEDDLLILWKLYNEVDYVNENIITTSLDDNVTAVDVQNELFKCASDELSAYSRPQFTYKTSIDNLLAMYDYRMFHKDLSCGNFIRVMTNDYHQVKLRVISISFNPLIMENDLSIEFSNMILSRNGRIDSADLLSISSNQKANSITGTSTNSTSGIDITQQMISALLKSPQFRNYSQNLSNDVINIIAGSLQTGSITSEELKTKLAQIDELEANSAFIKYLETTLVVASEIKVDDLKAKLAQIDVAQIGDVFANSLQVFTSTVAEQTINEAYIMNAIIGKLSVGDLAAGNIVLNDTMQILSENGKMIMNGSALQIMGTDTNGNDYVGIQLGYDTQSNPSLILRNENGATILTPEGITSDAIADGLIVNNMVQNGTLGKEKLGFEIIEPNEQGGMDIRQVYDGTELFGVKYTTFTETTTAQIANLDNKIDQSATYTLYIEMPNGNKMRPEGIQMTAHLFKNSVEVTDLWEDSYFTWKRSSSDNYGDTYWNDAHNTGTKTLTITGNDVNKDAVFQCKFETEQITVVSET